MVPMKGIKSGLKNGRVISSVPLAILSDSQFISRLLFIFV